MVFCGRTKKLYSFELGCVRPDRQLANKGLVLNRNRIGMSLPCKECGLVVFIFFQKQFYEENKHALVKYMFILFIKLFFASVSLLTHLNIQ